MDRSPNSLIGGTTAAARNVISGNALTGINTNTNVTVQGNYIGTNALGTAAVGNGNWGVSLGDNSIIGGTTAGAGNVISANGVNGSTMRFSQGASGGVFLQSGNLLQGNYIGTNAAGTAALGNQGTGVFGQAGTAAIIGGTTPAARNIISGNTGHGFVENNNPGRVLQGNYIGTAADGVSPLGNGGNGLVVACCATVGGTTAGAGNVIAFNRGVGVLTNTTYNRDAIRRNSIFSNGALGIDSNNDGVTANSNCAGTNFPVLTSAPLSRTTALAGTINNDNNASVDIDLVGNSSCDASGHGQC